MGAHPYFVFLEGIFSTTWGLLHLSQTTRDFLEIKHALQSRPSMCLVLSHSFCLRNKVHLCITSLAKTFDIDVCKADSGTKSDVYAIFWPALKDCYLFLALECYTKNEL